MAEQLPLFPLGTVLFPGLVLPLHVFEERYRALVRDLAAYPEGVAREFGVVAIRHGREVGADGVQALYDVGCTARLHEVQPYEDGRFDLITAGSRRFRLHGVDTSRPYLVGAVDFLDEPGGDDADVLAGSVRRRFAAYRAALVAAQQGRAPTPGEGSSDLPPLPEDPTVLSYLVAAAMVLDLSDKQSLLAAPDTGGRLRRELGLLRREQALLRHLPSLPAVELARSPYASS